MYEASSTYKLWPYWPMMWQVKQKDVCFARSMWFSSPSRPAKTGKIKNARKASIFPPRATVRLGRSATKPARTIVITRTASIRDVGMNGSEVVNSPLLQTANVFDQLLDLIISELLVVSMHFALAFFCGLDQLCVA